MPDEMKKCPMCGEEILAVARKCKHCGELLEAKPSDQTIAKPEEKPVQKKDELEAYWYIIVWCSVIVPCAGWLIVLLTSINYYIWKKDFPNKAKTINKHGWGAFIVWFLVWGSIKMAMKSALGVK